jgi:hypothetical protein
MTGFYIINGKGTKIPYTFTKKEYEEYLAVIDLMGIWGGIPCDVGWARGTNSYQESLKYYKGLDKFERILEKMDV